MYLIQQKFDTSLFWSNDNGWGLCADATVFTRSESEALPPPIDGVWITFTELRQEIDRLHEVYDELNGDLRFAAQSLGKIREVLKAYR
jgi:hypothetical protein